MDAFQLSITIAMAAIGLVNLLVGAVLNHMLQELRNHRALHDEKDYLPRSDHVRHEESERKSRHDLSNRLVALEIKAGQWKE